MGGFAFGAGFYGQYAPDPGSSVSVPSPAVLTIAGVYQDAMVVPGCYQDALDVPGHYQTALDVPGRLE